MIGTFYSISWYAISLLCGTLYKQKQATRTFLKNMKALCFTYILSHCFITTHQLLIFHLLFILFIFQLSHSLDSLLFLSNRNTSKHYPTKPRSCFTCLIKALWSLHKEQKWLRKAGSGSPGVITASLWSSAAHSWQQVSRFWLTGKQRLGSL